MPPAGRRGGRRGGGASGAGARHAGQRRCGALRRELSFDVLIEDLGGADYTFAVTELPMEVVVAECKHTVETDCVKLYLRKWAKTGWFKLQLQR